MVSLEEFTGALQRYGVTLYTGVPDSLLKDFVAYIARREKNSHVVAANEGNAVALAAGHFLATGKLACVYMQNSGMGNAVNPLVSLADPAVYGIPMLLLIGWRAEPGVKDEPQHVRQGVITPALLKTLGIPYKVLPASDKAAKSAARWAALGAKKNERPYALVVRKGSFFAYSKKLNTSHATGMLREEALGLILSVLGQRDVVVSTTGKTSREVFEIRKYRGEYRGESHARDFLTVGSMGHTSSIALGIARAKKGRRVVCLDGDGALLMHMGALATIGVSGARNFLHIVLNNGAHESVGGQATVGLEINMPAIARACGYANVASVQTALALKKILSNLLRKHGPIFLEVKICVGSRADLGRPTISPQKMKVEFRKFLS
ncbi:MAG: hypothetical protein UY14_C0020G0002 [Parcubacteria group bacterium GW2011_GWA1_47_9]|nr:MAG: hypothetical protein UY14_C0020G0002 [Parcubacteria group bacterium GW2011_GWA1_47_9]